MKAASSGRSFLTSSAMSTTGPQTRLWQSAGVAKRRTTASCRRRRRSRRRACRRAAWRVSILARSPPTSSAVGVWMIGALSPTLGMSVKIGLSTIGWPALATVVVAVAVADHGHHVATCPCREVDLGGVDVGGGVGVGDGGLGDWKAGSVASELDAMPGRGRAALPLGARDVDGDLGVGDGAVLDGEDAEAEAVLARLKTCSAGATTMVAGALEPMLSSASVLPSAAGNCSAARGGADGRRRAVAAAATREQGEASGATIERVASLSPRGEHGGE